MTDLVDRLRLLESGARWMCAETADTLENAADEIERLRAALMRCVQYENKCDGTGKPCNPARCGCALEAEGWCLD